MMMMTMTTGTLTRTTSRAMKKTRRRLTDLPTHLRGAHYSRGEEAATCETKRQRSPSMVLSATAGAVPPSPSRRAPFASPRASAICVRLPAALRHPSVKTVLSLAPLDSAGPGQTLFHCPPATGVCAPRGRWRRAQRRFFSTRAPPLTGSAEKRVQADLEEMSKHPIEGIAVIPHDNNIGIWQIFVEGTKDSPFEGGVFELEMKFPEDYPGRPRRGRLHCVAPSHQSFFRQPALPVLPLRVLAPQCVPRRQGGDPPIPQLMATLLQLTRAPRQVCMSSLHPSGDNEMDNETFDIRWKPINSVSSILNSVLLILQEPNFSSPANIDASVQWQREYDEYKVRIKALCDQSMQVFKVGNGHALFCFLFSSSELRAASGHQWDRVHPASRLQSGRAVNVQGRA